MNKIKSLFLCSMLVVTTLAFGQTEKKVSAIKAGSTLTDADIGFLSMVSNSDLGASRGAGTPSATVNTVTYKSGQTLSAADAKQINKAIKTFQKGYKAPDASRSGLCWCWYYYCDYYGYCYWYKYYCYC